MYEGSLEEVEEPNRRRRVEEVQEAGVAETPVDPSRVGKGGDGRIHRRKRRQDATRPGECEEARVRCNRCAGAHATVRCPHFPRAREAHRDAWDSVGKRQLLQAVAVEAIQWEVLHVEAMLGDGNCMFHALRFGSEGRTDTQRAQELRMTIVEAMIEQPTMTVGGASIAEWVQRDTGMEVREYADRLKQGAWGGGLELAVYARLSETAVRVLAPIPGSSKVKALVVFGDVPSRGGGVVNILHVGGERTTTRSRSTARLGERAPWRSARALPVAWGTPPHVPRDSRGWAYWPTRDEEAPRRRLLWRCRGPPTVGEGSVAVTVRMSEKEFWRRRFRCEVCCLCIIIAWSTTVFDLTRV